MLIQTQKTSLRPVTTAHLAQTMTLLGINRDELRQKLEAELATNPALELMDEARCPHCNKILPKKGPCPKCSSPNGTISDEPIVFVSPREDFTFSPKQYLEERSSPDEWTAAKEDLPTYVLRQIAPDLAKSDRSMAAHILTSMDEDGLLSISLFEIARYHHVPLSRIENILHLIQRAEPIGVGSPTSEDALLVQLEVLAETRPVPPLAAQAIREGMDLLSRRSFSELGHRLQVTTHQAKTIATFISKNLNPFPARAHWGDVYQKVDSPHIITNADIIINRLHKAPDTPLVVEIVSPYAGSLRVSPLFRKAIVTSPEEKRKHWKADLESASLLVKCLQQRDHTLVRLMQRLAQLQRKFIMEGDAKLVPITRAQLAIDLEVHESTISRAVAKKTVQLPNRRIIPLAKMFDRSLHIRTALCHIVAQETKPLSDAQIAHILAKRGYTIARRTVAKYRSMEGILPARLRHNKTDLNEQ